MGYETKGIQVYRTTNFTMVNNDPIRNLDDLGTLGMLTYLISHAEGFKITKVGLQNRFGRAAATKSLVRLEDEGFFLSFKVRKGSHLAFRYFVSDNRFTEEQVNEIAEMILTEEGILRIEDLPGYYSYLYGKDKEARVTNDSGAPNLRNPKKKKKPGSNVEFQHLKPENEESQDEKKPVKNTKGSKKTKSKKTRDKKTTTKPENAQDEKTSSSVVVPTREEIRKTFVESFGEQLVDKVETDLLVDKSVSISTDKQYGAMMLYRLNLAQNKGTSSAGANLPAWFEKEIEDRKKYEEAQSMRQKEIADSLTDEDLERMLKELGSNG